MKRDVLIFDSTSYASASDGTAQLFLHELGICPVLGQGKQLEIELIGKSMSASTARCRLTLYESTNPNGRPRDSQKQLGPQVVISALRPELIWVYGPFASYVEVCMEIYDTNSPTAQVFFELSLRATVHA